MNEGVLQKVKSFLNILQDGSITAKLSSGIGLELALVFVGASDPAAIEKLSIVGEIKRSDLKYIRKKMANTLKVLDLSKTIFENDRLPNKAFDKCYALTSIILPNTLIEIRQKTFSFCTALTSVKFPDSVVMIGDLAFYRCTSLTSITIPDSVVEICFRAFAECSGLSSITIPDSVAKIESGAFGNCTGLTTVNFPETEVEIGNYAFFNCSGLTSVNIPKEVIKIGEAAFGDCPPVITVHPDNPVYYSEEGKLKLKINNQDV